MELWQSSLDALGFLIASIADDWNDSNEPQPRFLEHDAILSAITDAEILEPLREMRKAEVMQSIPDDLLSPNLELL